MSKLGIETVCTDEVQAKQRAQAIKTRMADLGHKIPLTHAYEIMATTFGHRNWPTMKASLKTTTSLEPAKPDIALEAITDGLINALTFTFEGDPDIVKPMTRLTPGKVDLIIGPPGTGKTTFVDALNAVDFQARLRAGKPLPYMFILGSPNTYKAIASAVQEALPPRRQKEVNFIKFSKFGSRINPFDTSLGFRKPTSIQKHSLITFLMAVSSVNGEKIFENLWRPILHQMIDRLYELYSDVNDGPLKKRVSVTPDNDLNSELIKLGLLNDGPERKSWWEIVDILCSRGLYDLAELAQRYAVPNGNDMLSLISGPEGVRFASNSDMSTIKSCLGRGFNECLSIGKRTTVDSRNSKIVVFDHDVYSKTPLHMSHFLLSRLYFGRDIYIRNDDCTSLHNAARSYHEGRIKDRSDNGVCVIYDDFERYEGPVIGETLTRDAVYIKEIGGTFRVISQVSSPFKFFDMAAATDISLLSPPKLNDSDLLRRFGVEPKQFDSELNRLTGPSRAGLPIARIRKASQNSCHVVLLKMSGAALWALSPSREAVRVRNALAKRIGMERAITLLAEKFPRVDADSYIEKIARERAATSAEYSYRDLIEPVTDELIDRLASDF